MSVNMLSVIMLKVIVLDVEFNYAELLCANCNYI
jgi:hypothetical protein